MNTKFRTRFNRAPVKGVRFERPSLVQPQFKAASDINTMIKRALGGDMSVFRARGHMVDASAAPESYHDAMNIVARAEQAWDSLPDAVRRAYGNPATFVAEFEKSLRTPVEASDNVSDSKEDKNNSHPEGAEPSTAKSVPTT